MKATVKFERVEHFSTEHFQCDVDVLSVTGDVDKTSRGAEAIKPVGNSWTYTDPDDPDSYIYNHHFINIGHEGPMDISYDHFVTSSVWFFVTDGLGNRKAVFAVRFHNQVEVYHQNRLLAMAGFGEPIEIEIN